MHFVKTLEITNSNRMPQLSRRAACKTYLTLLLSCAKWKRARAYRNFSVIIVMILINIKCRVYAYNNSRRIWSDPCKNNCQSSREREGERVSRVEDIYRNIYLSKIIKRNSARAHACNATGTRRMYIVKWFSATLQCASGSSLSEIAPREAYYDRGKIGRARWVY